jgi:hypothetical protein
MEVVVVREKRLQERKKDLSSHVKVLNVVSLYGWMDRFTLINMRGQKYM